MTTKSTEPTIDTAPFHDQTEVWTKSLSILMGIREVLAETRAQTEAVTQANHGQLFPKGYGERAALIEALSEADRTLAWDLRRLAKANGLTLTERLG